MTYIDHFAMRSAEGNAAVSQMVRAALKTYPFYGQERQLYLFLLERIPQIAEKYPTRPRLAWRSCMQSTMRPGADCRTKS